MSAGTPPGHNWIFDITLNPWRLKGSLLYNFQDWGIKTNANHEFIKLRAADGGCSVLRSEATRRHLCVCLGTHGREQNIEVKASSYYYFRKRRIRSVSSGHEFFFPWSLSLFHLRVRMRRQSNKEQKIQSFQTYIYWEFSSNQRTGVDTGSALRVSLI